MAPKHHNCNECGKLFPYPSQLAEHLRVHSGEKPFICEQCGIGFAHKVTLVRHRITHSGEKPYQCTECGARFGIKQQLQRHQRTHTGERPFVCETCDHRFAGKSQLHRHRRIHTGEKPYQCELCGKRFAQVGYRQKHLLVHTGEKPYVCGECGDSFKSKNNLTIHQRTHSGEKPYECECGKRFSQKGLLRQHRRIHTGEKPYVCEECGDSFRLKRALMSHQRKHTGEKPFQCEVCDKQFAQKGSLRNHLRVHADADAFRCAECGKSFSGQRLLREHMLHHTDPDQFKCFTCGRQFVWKLSLLEHNVSCASHFMCDTAGCEFVTKKYVELEDHRVKEHGKQRRLKCPICDKCFSSYYSLTQHERRAHNGCYRSACDKCGAGFDSSVQLRAHKNNCNGVAAAFRARVRQVAEKHRIEKDYELTKEIVGQGLSSVFKAKGLRPSDIGKEFAVKKIDCKRDTPVETKVATYRALTEARIAKSRCGHENTASVEAVYYQDCAVYTVAKLVRPGNLLTAVTNLRLKGKLFGEAHVANIMKDILSGLLHIHGQGLLHRDMKTANVLIGADGVCMILDFGESATSGPHRGTGVGTDGYRPPEAWGDEKQTTALDVYPLGIIAAECMAMRGAPKNYEEEAPRGVIAWMRRWVGYSKRQPPSPQFEYFLEQCLRHDAAARPTVAALLEDPFIKLADLASLKERVSHII